MSSISRNFLFNGILTTANYVFPLLTYPYVSRVLGPGNIGLVNFIDGIIDYFVLVSMMGIGILGIREIAQCGADRKELSKTFLSLLTINAVTTVAALALLGAGYMLVPELNGQPRLVGIGACKLMFNFLLVEWFYKGIEDFRYITIRSILVKSVYVAGVFLFVRDADDYNVYYGLLVGCIVVNACINTINIRRYVTLRGLKLRLHGYVKPYFVLGAYMLLTSMYTTFNVAYLGFVGGDVQVGYYTTATKLYTILLALFTAFTAVMMPRMSSLLSEGRHEEFKGYVGQSTSILINVSMPLIGFVIIYAPEIIRLIAGNEYGGAVTPMRIIIPLIFIIGYEQILVIQTLLPMKKDRAVFRNSIIGAVAGVSLNLLLVPKLHSTGSAIVWVVCEVLILILSQLILCRELKIGFPFAKFIKGILVYFPLWLIVWAMSYIPVNYVVSLLVSGIVAAIYFALVQISIYKNEAIGVFIRRKVLSLGVKK